MRRNQKRGLSFFTVGVIAIVVALVATYFGFTKSVPFRDHYEVSAMFRTANNVKPDSPVRVAGVNIGKVSEVKLLRPGQPAAEVKLRLDKAGLPLHEDATFKVRPRIFLEGNFFVDVQPGTPSAKTVDDGHTFPVQQASSPVQLDQITTSLQSATRKDLQKLLQELSSGLKAPGATGYNRSIEHWEPAYRHGAELSDATLGQAEHDLSEYIANAGVVAEALDRNPQQLKSLVTDLNTTAAAFARRDQRLEQAIAELPRTLAAAQPALRELNRSFPAVRRFIRDFRPAVRSSGPALDASLPLTRQLRGLVSRPELRGLVGELRPAVPDLARLNEATVPLYEQVRAASSCQNEVILPWTHDKVVDDTFPATGKVYEESVKPLPGLAGESRSGDANGQWFRVLLSGGNYAYPLGADRFLFTGSPIQGVNPPAPEQRTPLRPDVPCETQERPDLRSKPGPPPAGFRVEMPNTPEARARHAKAQKTAIDWLRHRIKVEGLDHQLKVADDPLKPGELPSLKGLGLLGKFPVAKEGKGK
jgi:phospholipid/cholesterol/gamma-HCH transport system substrate-binding protein